MSGKNIFASFGILMLLSGVAGYSIGAFHVQPSRAIIPDEQKIYLDLISSSLDRATLQATRGSHRDAAYLYLQAECIATSVLQNKPEIIKEKKHFQPEVYAGLARLEWSISITNKEEPLNNSSFDQIVFKCLPLNN